MWLFAYFLHCVFAYVVTSFNLDTKDTFQEYSIEDKNLQFGYTVNFLNTGRLIVGAPPVNQSDTGMDTGAIYSCDVRNNSCEKITEDPKPLVPKPTSRCFLPPYNATCNDAGSLQYSYWYYDPLYTSCKPFAPGCRNKVAKQNIFANETACVETCKHEMMDRISNTTQVGHPWYCSVTFQNLHADSVDLLQKDKRGDTSHYHTMDQGEVISLRREYSQVCGIPFLARSSKSSEYLYFIDVVDNSFDVIFMPRDRVTVSIGTMEQIRLAFYGKSTPKMGLLVQTFQHQIFACEPQYNRKYIGPVGRCSMYSSDSYTHNTVTQYSVIPLEDGLRKNLREFKSSVGGFSATQTSEDSSVIFVSAPNVAGQGFIAALSSVDGRNLGGQLNPIRRTKARDLSSESYFGYSLSAGRFKASRPASLIDGWRSGIIAGGSPRGGLKRAGYVLIVSFSEDPRSNFKVLQRLDNPDQRIGHYFGSSVCVADLNNDGQDDVLVGSPYFTKMRDEGRVYVYINKVTEVELKFTLEGKPVPGARFGTTITDIGDINRDGFIDVAVGAPGGERGAVYIFNGNTQGINPRYSQVIDETNTPNLAKGFGISIAGDFDVNGDSYKDIAVGGHIGGIAYIFKSRPVILMKRMQSVNTASIPYQIESSNCQGPDNEAYYCVNLTTLISYTGKGVPDTYNVDITYNMDANKISKRAKIISSGTLVNKRTDRVELKKGVEKEISDKVYLKVEKHGVKVDLFTPITQVTSYKDSSGGQSCVNNLCSLLPKVEDTTTVLGYSIKCSNTSYCRPYLTVSMNLELYPVKQSRENEIIYGVTKRIIVTTRINNTGEVAYQPKLMMRFRSDVDVNSAKWGPSSLQWDISSITPEDKFGNDKELSIYLPSISTGSQLAIVIHFSLAKSKPTTLLPYTFATRATALDIDRTPQYHNNASVSAPVVIETCQHVKQASAEPSPILYNPLEKSEDDKYGKSVVYSYYVRNSGQNTLDSLFANVSLADEAAGIRFMCVHSVIGDQVHCNGFTNCHDYLQERQNPNKAGKRNRHFISMKCRINSIKVGEGVDIRIKAVYFPEALGKLSQSKDVNFPDTYMEFGELNTTFTPIVEIYHDDAFVSLYYQYADCPADKSATVTFIKVEPEKEKEVPSWVYIISTLLALLLLLCIILILWKYGFFKKNIEEITAPLVDHEIGDGGDDEEEESISRPYSIS